MPPAEFHPTTYPKRRNELEPVELPKWDGTGNKPWITTPYIDEDFVSLLHGLTRTISFVSTPTDSLLVGLWLQGGDPLHVGDALRRAGKVERRRVVPDRPGARATAAVQSPERKVGPRMDGHVARLSSGDPARTQRSAAQRTGGDEPEPRQSNGAAQKRHRQAGESEPALARVSAPCSLVQSCLGQS